MALVNLHSHINSAYVKLNRANNISRNNPAHYIFQLSFLLQRSSEFAPCDDGYYSSRIYWSSVYQVQWSMFSCLPPRT